MYTLTDDYVRPSGRCVICTLPFDEQEQVALVFGTDEDRYEWTGTFGFPAAKAPLACTFFSRYAKPRRGRLCYNPFQSSNGSTFHLVCFNGSKAPGTSFSLHLQHIWRFSSWVRPWSTVPSLYDLETCQPIPYEPTNDEYKRAYDVQDRFWYFWRKLPPETKLEIMTMAYGSLLWSVFAARNWRKRLNDLAGKRVTRLITDVEYWDRSGRPPESDSTGDVVTIAIDNLGIRSLKVSESWPSAASDQATVQEVYIVEHVSSLSGLHLEQQGGYCRLQQVKTPLRLWDTPTPPPLDSCQFGKDQFGEDHTPPSRLKTIKLNLSLKGLSVLCWNGFTYGIYPHHTDDPAFILDAFNHIPSRRRKTLLWLFFPLAQQQIEDVWLRCESRPTLPPVLVIRTSRDQIYTFGPHSSGCTFQYLGSTPSHIVFEHVPLGEAITALGIATEVSPMPYRSPLSCHTLSPPPDAEGYYYYSAPLRAIQEVTSYYVEGYCVGIMIKYHDGLQQPLGQCRPDADIYNVDSPFSFHHRSEIVGRKSKELVRWSMNQQEYQGLAKPGWESTVVDAKLTWLRWWCDDTSSFCSVFIRPDNHTVL